MNDMQYNEFLRTKQTAPQVAGIDYSGEFNSRMFDYFAGGAA